MEMWFNRFKKSDAGYVATPKEMTQHNFEAASNELAKSVEMGKRFKSDLESGRATVCQLHALEYQQGLSDFYLKRVDFGKLIY